MISLCKSTTFRRKTAFPYLKICKSDIQNRQKEGEKRENGRKKVLYYVFLAKFLARTAKSRNFVPAKGEISPMPTYLETLINPIY